MKNDSNILKRTSRVVSPLPSDPLERARREAQDVKDIERDKARQLRAYDADEEESTARHDIPQIVIHNHQHSQPDTEPELGELPRLTRGFPRWLQLAIGVVLAVATAVISHWAAGAK